MSDLDPGLIHSRWRRLIFTAMVACLFVVDLYKPARARVHWAGRKHRPRRLERALGLFIFCGAFIFLEIEQRMLWVSLWGGVMSAIVILRSFYLVIPRKKYHWMGEQR